MKKAFITVAAIAVIVVIGLVARRELFGVQEVTVDLTQQEQKIQQYAHPESFITADGLKALIDQGDDVIVIGALNPAKGDAPIKESFTLWRDAYSASDDAYPYGGMRNTTEEMEDILSSYGATPQSTIVVYAANAHHDAGRLWWQIKLLGHEDVRYLDGGLNAWVGAGYPTGNRSQEVVASNYIAPNPSTDSLATIEDVSRAIQVGTPLIDTRSEEEETGASTKSGAFGPGKIPTADWINWTEAVDEDTLLKSKTELEALYGQYKEDDVIAYCQSGVRSAYTYFVLTQALGYEHVKNYDGSWIEWSYEYYEEHQDDINIENGDI